MATGKLEELPLDSITLDKRLQMRPKLSEATVERYSEVLSEGASMPAAVVFFDGSTHWLADGFHRYFGSKKAECETLYCEVRSGTLSDAFLFALGANGDNGLPRDPETMETVMRAAFAAPECKDFSDRKLATVCNISHVTVGKWRKKLTPSKSGGKGLPPEKRKGKDGKSYPVSEPKPKKKQAEPQFVGDDEPVLTAEDWKAAETEKDVKGHARAYLKGASKSLAAIQDNITLAVKHGAKCDLAVMSQAARSLHAVIEQGGKSL